MNPCGLRSRLARRRGKCVSDGDRGVEVMGRLAVHIGLALVGDRRALVAEEIEEGSRVGEPTAHVVVTDTLSSCRGELDPRLGVVAAEERRQEAGLHVDEASSVMISNFRHPGGPALCASPPWRPR